MKFKKIVGFGDSWVYGDELLDPELLSKDPDAHSCYMQNDPYRLKKCFLGQLGERYQCETENFGIPGGSLQSTIWTYLWWIQNEPSPQDCLILVFLTEPDRDSFYNPRHRHYSNDPPWNKFVHSTWARTSSDALDSEFTDLIKRYTVLTHSTDFSRLKYLEAMMFFDGQSARNNIPLLQWHGAEPLTDYIVPTLMRPKFNWINYFLSHPGNQKRELIMPDGHPNEKGHELIADILQTDIDRVILSK